MLNFDNDDMVPHFIYCWNNFKTIYDRTMEVIILSRIKLYGIQTSIFTGLRMTREFLITQEKSTEAYEGKLTREYHWRDYKASINEDLESYINHLQEISSLEEVKQHDVWSFFLPKLTEEELKLVEKKDAEHVKTYFWPNPDVDEEEMKKSDSKDKFVHGRCYRRTKVLKLDEILFETQFRNSIRSSESSSTITNESESSIQTSAEEEKCCCCDVS